jgi:SAM-dependent methyltransferase
VSRTCLQCQALRTAPKTRDGCSVDLYLRLPYRGEVELICSWLPPGASILELGCGVGRITRRLLALCYRVTAIDNSPDMLSHVPNEASRLCADIEDLDLGVTFDAIIFASCLINISDGSVRARQLTKCRQHLQLGSPLLFERYDPAWLASVAVDHIGDLGKIQMYVDDVSRQDAEVELCCRYQENEDSWSHRFIAHILDDAAVREILCTAGFGAPKLDQPMLGRRYRVRSYCLTSRLTRTPRRRRWRAVRSAPVSFVR